MNTFNNHLSKVGAGLKTAIEGYNKAVGSYETRVLPQGRKIEDLLEKESGQRLPERLDRLEGQPREIASSAISGAGESD